MIIKSLELENYRNYKSLKIEFDKGVNILYGDNAQGKTNILESIYVSATARSHKGARDKDIINFDSEEGHIKTLLDKDGLERRVDMHLRRSKSKGVAVDKVRIKKTAELLGILNVVFFSPEDLSIIKNAPAERRKFANMELCQLDQIYLYNLNNYNKIMTQRNNILKEINFRPDYRDMLSIYDSQLISYGKKLIARRHQFCDEMNSILESIHKSLSGNKEVLEMRYAPMVTEDEYEDRLKADTDRDIRYKMTSAGPHRDDFVFLSNGIDLRTYGSQGQQRTAALSLKLSEIELVKRITKDNPVLLLDDVLSELDSNRQTHLLNSIGDIQTIITCTGLDDFVNNRFEYDKVFKVTEGTVRSEN
jgi:DNA replication and repair protein RecF